MSKLIAMMCALVLVSIGALAPVNAGEEPRASNATYIGSSAADALFQRVAAKPCCFNNGEYFTSSPSTCRRYGGRVVRYEYCERSYYGQGGYGGYGGDSGKPCCYNNGQYFNATPSTCQRYGGRPARQDRCDRYYNDQGTGDQGGYGDQGTGDQGYGNYETNLEKPCCHNNGQYFNTTPSTCRKYGGQVAPIEHCLRPY